MMHRRPHRTKGRPIAPNLLAHSLSCGSFREDRRTTDRTHRTAGFGSFRVQGCLPSSRPGGDGGVDEGGSRLGSILRRSASSLAPLAGRLSAGQGNISHRFLLIAGNHTRKIVSNDSFLVPSVSHYFYSVSPALDLPSSDESLLRVIESEIKCSEESFEEKEDLPASFPFQLTDNPGRLTATLTREYQGETIHVEVEPSGLVTGEEDSTSNEDEDEDEDGSKKASLPMVVKVSKPDGFGLEFGINAYVDKIVINSLWAKDPDMPADQVSYQGPSFENGPPRLHRHRIRPVTRVLVLNANHCYTQVSSAFNGKAHIQFFLSRVMVDCVEWSWVGVWHGQNLLLLSQSCVMARKHDGVSCKKTPLPFGECECDYTCLHDIFFDHLTKLCQLAPSSLKASGAGGIVFISSVAGLAHIGSDLSMEPLKIEALKAIGGTEVVLCIIINPRMSSVNLPQEMIAFHKSHGGEASLMVTKFLTTFILFLLLSISRVPMSHSSELSNRRSNAQKKASKKEDLPASFPFQLTDNPGRLTATLTREYQGETIHVEVEPSGLTG
ncbi:hypothetical protein R6Q59_019677 [Mikania micrantha]